MSVEPNRILRLFRVSRNENSMFGVFILPTGEPIACSVEPAWRNNEKNNSCIPTGIYPLKTRVSIKTQGHPTLEVCDVPNRMDILIHPGNTFRDTLGCILPGLSFGALVPETTVTWGVHHSREAWAAIMRAVERNNLTHLEVVS